MNAPYVCLQCSRQLFRSKCPRRSSGFVSLGQSFSCDDDGRTTPREVPPTNGELLAFPSRNKYLTFAQTHQEREKPKGVDKVLETLFASNREDQRALKISRYSRIPKIQPLKPKVIEASLKDHMRELRNKMRRGTVPLQEIWKDCESLLGKRKWMHKDIEVNEGDKNISDYSFTSVDTVANSHTFRDILVAVCQKQPLVFNGRNFTPADAIKTYSKHGVMSDWWHHVLWCQLGRVLQLRYQSADETPGVASDEKIRILLGEVLEVWNLYMGMYGLHRSTVSVPLSMDPDRVDELASTSEGSSSSFPMRLRTKITDDITVAAAMTLECLKAAGIEAPLQIMSVFRRFGQALKRDPSTATRCLLQASVSSDITEKAVEGWRYQPWRKAEEILEPSESSFSPRASKSPVVATQTRHLDWGEKGLRTHIAEIEGAAKRSDTKSVITLWHQFQAHLEADKSVDKVDANDEVYVRFIRAFVVLRRHEHAIAVWNHMLNCGHLPNQKHWSAMLSSCVRTKDVESLQRIWINMLRSGVLPDIHTWTTYIQGLINGHKLEEGLNALEHLGRIWKSAPPLKPFDNAADTMTGSNSAGEHQTIEKFKDDTVLHPTAVPINAALTALIHINKTSLFPRVVAWAKSHDVPLSTVTFNILLRPLVRQGSKASIQAHLQQMAEANCTPDVATFGIILNGLVSNPTSTFHSLPPEAQEGTITSILAEMERQGMEPNFMTYSTILDGLLSPGTKEPSRGFSPNVPAASTILAHMAARNMYPSPSIYTILISYYFTRRPVPDLPAISSLWSSIRHSGQMRKLDLIFFDRLIEGYADSDQLELALKFLKLVPEQGKSPGWWALNRVLKALVRAREWQLCEELADDVEREGGLLRYGRGRGLERYRTEFWELVDVLRERGYIGKGDEER